MKVLVVILALLLAAAPIHAQTSTIKLKRKADVATGRPITIGDVATVSGGDVESLAAIRLVESFDQASSNAIDPQHIREALRREGINLGLVSLSGAPCEVTDQQGALRQLQADAALPDEDPESQSRQGPTVLAQEHGESPTVSGAIATKLAELYNVDPSRLRLRFEERHEALLSTLVNGRSIAIQPAGTGKRVPVKFQIYRGDRIESTGTVRVEAEVLRDVVITTRAIARGEPILEEALIREARWLPHSTESASPDAVPGTVAQTRLEAGRIVESKDVQPPLAIKKGDICQVDCISGGIAIQSQARAAENGKEGEVIRFFPLGSKNAFRARVDGPGRAVLVIERGIATR